MNGFRPYLRLISLALVAIAGMLSPAGMASAFGSTDSRTNRAGSCCVKPVCSGCCCDSASSSSRSASVKDSSVLARRGVSLSFRGGNCECRSSEQPASTPRPESRPVGSRADRDRHEAKLPTFHTSSTFTWLIREPDFPSGSPLYLRNKRLRI
jgi:hypothetical protein